jgi:meiotically up-regulated gene 157 (Mug157) protein
MVKSAFRPSDDACVFAYNVPSNAFLSAELKRSGEMLNKCSDLLISNG